MLITAMTDGCLYCYAKFGAEKIYKYISVYKCVCTRIIKISNMRSKSCCPFGETGLALDCVSVNFESQTRGISQDSCQSLRSKRLSRVSLRLVDEFTM